MRKHKLALGVSNAIILELMNKLIHLSMVVAIATFTGCSTHPKGAHIHERGWIGGRYKCAKAHANVANWISGGDHIIYSFPPDLDRTQASGILVTELGTNSPLYRAGLCAGDLILEVSHRPVPSLPAFWTRIHAARSGATLPVKAYRNGRTIECEVAVGREKYQQWATLAIGLPGFWECLHPVPTGERPLFSLIALGWQGEETSPVEFDSVKERYRRECHPKDGQKGEDRDWRGWLAIVQLSKAKTILSQESVVTTNSVSVY